MQSDSYIVPECIIGPRSFGALMALYESNFIKFNRLLGAVDDRVGQSYSSQIIDDCDLYLTVESVEKYTRVMRLTYEIVACGEPVADPDLTIRMYTDARMTEVAGWASHHRHAELKCLAKRYKRELDKRWSRNMMLGKWLDYLTDKGHAFSPIQRLPVQVSVSQGATTA
jgi:uncharacterized protein YqiB (DUF1249 family)